MFAYRLFLGRDPESDAVINAKLHSSADALPWAFLDSDEFEASVLRPALEGRPLPSTYTALAAPELLDWAYDTFGASAPCDTPMGHLLASVLKMLTPELGKKRPPQIWTYLARCLEAPSRPRPVGPMNELLISILCEEENPDATRIAYDALLRREAYKALHFADPPSLKISGAFNPDQPSERTLIEQSGLWDAAFYLGQNPELNPEVDLLADFISRGCNSGRDPHPLFSSAYYLAACPNDAEAGSNPLLHYLRHGHLNDFSPNPLFSPDWYRRTYLLGQRDIEPLGHYVREGARLRLRPHPLFDREYYERLYPDIAAAGIDAYQHFIAYGLKEARQAFDFTRAGCTLKIAVVAHVFYEDLWPELFTQLSAIPRDFDLIVTISQGAPASLRQQILADVPQAHIVDAPNHGYDIGPFLLVLPMLLDKSYDLVCKVHTKRGATEPETWRRLLLESVLGSTALVQRILACFEQDIHLAIVGGDIFYLDGLLFSQLNMRHLTALFSDIYSNNSEIPSSWGFFAGTMFWFRPQYFEKLMVLDKKCFEGSNLMGDSQPAHAIERLFGVLPAQEGGRVGLVNIQGPQAALEIDVKVAPNRVSQQELAVYLPLRKQQLADIYPEFGKSKPKIWLAPTNVELGVNLIGPVETVNGLGVSTRGYARAIEQTRLPLTITKWKTGFEHLSMQPYPDLDGGTQPINLVHLNLDFLFVARLIDSDPLKSLMSPGKFNIAIIYWELAAMPPEWTPIINRFDEIWVSSDFMARAVGAVSSRSVRVVRPAVLPTWSPKASGTAHDIAPGRFLFAYSADAGSIMNRKNPQLLWRTYADTFSIKDGVALAIKLHRPDNSDPRIKEIKKLALEREDIIYISESFSEAEMARFFARTDCYVSPHRSEGLGLTILEAMQAGKPVIATAYGGAADFVTPQTAFVIDHRLAEVGPGSHPYPANYVWADPIPESLSVQFKDVISNPSLAGEKTVKARATCEKLFGSTTTASSIYQELVRVWHNGKGSYAAFRSSV